MSLHPTVIAVMLLALAGCAAGGTSPWAHPGLPKEQWARDHSACKRYADREVGWRDDDAPSPFRDYDRSQAKRQYDAAVGACMRDLGYVPARKR